MTLPIHVINYHSIDDSGSVLSIAPALFRSHIQAWKRRGARFFTLEEAELFVRGESSVSAGLNILITFDDGLESVYREAFPILRDAGATATVFICTALMGRDNMWPGQPDWVPRMDIMTWDQASEMAEAGIEFGSHLLDHPDLAEISEPEGKRQIVESSEEIERRLGTKPRALAFPYGRSTQANRRDAAEVYALAFGTRLGPTYSGGDPMDLPRLDAYYLKTRVIYENIDRPIGRAYLALRSAIRRLRGG